MQCRNRNGSDFLQRTAGILPPAHTLPDIEFSTTILLELPISIVEWADLTCLQPSGDAVEMKGVLAQCQQKHGQMSGY
jgi:hypothetical protein